MFELIYKNAFNEELRKIASVSQTIISDMSKSTFKSSASKKLTGFGKVRGSTTKATPNLNNQNLYTNPLTGSAPKIKPTDMGELSRKAEANDYYSGIVDRKILKPRIKNLSIGPSRQPSFKASAVTPTTII